MNKSALPLMLLIIALCLPQLSFAAPPIPARKADSAHVRAQLKREKSAVASIQKETKGLKSDLTSLRANLVKQGKKVQENEKLLFDLEKRAALLEQERTGIQDKLNEDQKSMSHLILALHRLSRVPPQAMVLNPDGPLEAAQSSLVLSDILPRLQKQSEALRERVERLNDITAEIDIKTQNAIAVRADLKEKNKELASLVAQKDHLYKSKTKDLSVKQAEIGRISLKAKNLDDLVGRIEAHQKEERTRAKKKAISKKTKRAIAKAASLPKQGAARLPVPGTIITRYKDKDQIGAESLGLTIRAPNRALVVAPMGGVVRFSGYFKNYGNMIIVEHENNYHSLIAGFEKIDTLVGQKVSPGEPVGRLFSGKQGKEPKLYYELRHKGKAVNPAVKFSNIG